MDLWVVLALWLSQNSETWLHWLTSVVSLHGVCRWHTTALCMAWRWGPERDCSGDNTRSPVTISLNHIIMALTDISSGRSVSAECWSWIRVWLAHMVTEKCLVFLRYGTIKQKRSGVPAPAASTFLGFSTSKRKLAHISHRPLVKCLAAFCGHLKPQMESSKTAKFASASCFRLSLHMWCQTSEYCIWKCTENRIKYKMNLFFWICVA